MGSSLTFHGQDGDVVLDDRTITLGGAGGGEPVVLPRSEIADVNVKSASLLAYGHVAITSRAGETYTVHFGRDAQDHFDNLKAILRP